MATNNKTDPLANWASPASEIEDPAVLQLYQDALEDVHTRFLLNLPEEELATADRILFQIEQAWWFYEDWICDRQDTSTCGALPRFKHVKPFAVEMFRFSPLLDTHQFHAMWALFSKYKRKISTYGCILLNADCTKIIMCQDWNSKSWTLPAGKINQGEEGIDAAARETWEETGFDPNGKYGLTQQMDPTWIMPLQEKDYVSYKDEIGKHRNFYICKVSVLIDDRYVKSIGNGHLTIFLTFTRVYLKTFHLTQWPERKWQRCSGMPWTKFPKRTLPCCPCYQK